MSTYFLKPLNIIIILLLLTSNSLAWDGYDPESNTKVEIGSGNLVREGNIITIYDWDLNKDIDVEVKSMNESFNGTRLEVQELESKKIRTLEMDG